MTSLLTSMMNTSLPPSSSLVAPNSPKQTAALTTAPTVPTVVPVTPSSLSDTSEALTEQISNLQNLENKKYIDLDILVKSNPTPDNIAQQKTIIDDITAISTLRSKLFDTLLNNTDNNLKVNNVMNSNLEDKKRIIMLQENELKAKNAALALVTDETNNAKKMVDINTYYHKQYAARIKIMKMIVLICFLIIFFVVLMHLGWLPQELVTVLVVIILFAGLIYIGYLINDMYQRSSINFDEYNFEFDSAKFGSQLSQQSTKSKKKVDRSSCLSKSVASEAASIEESISSKATSLESELTGGGGTPDPSQSSSSLDSASTSAGGSTDADGTTLPSVKSKLSESFIPLMSRMDRRQFNSNDARQPAAYDSENNYGKI
jgi:hypothetical protein